ncbi:nucleoside monophosphate kinase [Leptolyngbya sp. KIOST-1]|uniref:nucleoside monophosphate kinase n=1 Tax=Leptolyngbya sp. KIOST-1 TaxID=1229172 RepID=UPI000907A0AC|nr:nucleoside monophosphate kinase [Leptolyngbya sp. KIOST-1]
MTVKQVVVLGLPGVGVRDQAIELARRWAVPHVSMGDLLREAIAKASDIGLAVRPYVEAGDLVPDALAMKLLRRRLEQPDAMLNGWVLEGFPRTVAQAEALDQWLGAVGLPAATVVHLQAMTGLLLNRLWTEREPEETMPAIRCRLERHEAAIAPLLDYYRQHSQLTTLNGSRSFAEIASELAQLDQAETGAVGLIRDEAELDALLAQTPLLVVDCMASWCSSCKQVAPLIDRLAADYGDRVSIMKIDFDANQQISKRFSLQGIPSVMFFRDGDLRQTLTGVKPYQAYSTALTHFLE